MSRVTDIAPALSSAALQHFEERFSFETDCWDVQHTMRSETPDFVLLDVRGPEAYAAGHLPGAVSLPHARIDESMLQPYPSGALFVVYCAGPHCNGAYRAAVRLARLGRPVKVMIGGIMGWLDEGFELQK